MSQDSENPSSILSPFTAADGENIAMQDWPLPDHWPTNQARGLVLIVHGLGEHAARYAPLARELNAWGFVVRSYDHYGHGDSGGVQGGLPHDMRMIDDLADVVNDSRRMMIDQYGMQRHHPLILLGHSMGGVVAASFVRQNIQPVDGLILSSPALDPGFSRVQKLLLSVLPRFAPNMRLNNGLKLEFLSRNPDVLKAYAKDPLVHNLISARLAKFIAVEGQASITAAPLWDVPTLLVYAGSDRLVNPQGSREFAAAAPATVVQAQEFPAMYHEMFEDPERETVYAAIHGWLDARFKPHGSVVVRAAPEHAAIASTIPQTFPF
jgi:alpha-beta hydrolase superfamily lysophospholipase